MKKTSSAEGEGRKEFLGFKNPRGRDKKCSRTCIGCRRTGEKKGFLRLAVKDGRVTLDPGGRLPGRGAYIHPERECLEKACRRGEAAFSRVFKTRVFAPGIEELWGEIEKFKME